MVKLYINSTEIPLTKGSYKEHRSNYEVTGQTEAGTNRRDLVRSSIFGLSISLNATTSEKEILEAFNDEASLTVKYYKDSISDYVTWTAYMDGFESNLVTDGEWDCSFNLVDLEQ